MNGDTRPFWEEDEMDIELGRLERHGGSSIQAVGRAALRVIRRFFYPSGQLTSPVLTHDAGGNVWLGLVLNERGAVRVQVERIDRAGNALDTYSAPLAGIKPEGPGITIDAIGPDLWVVITGHGALLADNTRENVVALGIIEGICVAEGEAVNTDEVAQKTAALTLQFIRQDVGVTPEQGIRYGLRREVRDGVLSAVLVLIDGSHVKHEVIGKFKAWLLGVIRESRS